MEVTTVQDGVRDFIGGTWWWPSSERATKVLNQATSDLIARAPVGSAKVVAVAVEATAALLGWRATPAGGRAQFLFRFKKLLEDSFEEIARIMTIENGKTLVESRGELRCGIENVEVACGIPTMMQGYNFEDVASGIDEFMCRQPLGVVAAIMPFNFPVMIPLWFLPYAIARGNTFVLKPSERVPFGMTKIIELLESTGLPRRWRGIWAAQPGNRVPCQAGAKITSSCCRTPTWMPLRKSSPIAPTVALARGAWQSPLR